MGENVMKKKWLALILCAICVLFVGCNTDEDMQEQYDLGYGAGYDAGMQDGYDKGVDEGYNKGYSEAYDQGYADAQEDFASNLSERNAESDNDDLEEIVYVTNTGSCYHKENCGYLHSSKISIPLSEAKEKYRPCSRCF